MKNGAEQRTVSLPVTRTVQRPRADEGPSRGMHTPVFPRAHVCAINTPPRLPHGSIRPESHRTPNANYVARHREWCLVARRST